MFTTILPIRQEPLWAALGSSSQSFLPSTQFGNPRVCWASLVAQRLKHLPGMRETQVRSLGQEDPLEQEMATHFSTLAWKIPWTEPPGKIISLSLRAGKCIPQKTDLKEHPEILM